MANSINKVILIGRLGADVATDPNNKSSVKVARGSLACSESYQDSKTREWKEVVDWIQIRFYDKLAERAIERLKKGMEVYIEGKVKTWKYEKAGKTEYATAIKVEKFFTFKGSQAAANNAAPATTEENEMAEILDEKDLPF